MYHIIDNIYLSNLDTALKLREEFTNDIIIRLYEWPTNTGDYNFLIGDNQLFAADLIKYGYKTIKIIKNNPNRRILIHCNEGRSRSPSIIIMYLIVVHKKTFEWSLNFLQSIKPDVRPNIGFQQVLEILEKKPEILEAVLEKIKAQKKILLNREMNFKN